MAKTDRAYFHSVTDFYTVAPQEQADDINNSVVMTNVYQYINPIGNKLKKLEICLAKVPTSGETAVPLIPYRDVDELYQGQEFLLSMMPSGEEDKEIIINEFKNTKETDVRVYLRTTTTDDKVLYDYKTIKLYITAEDSIKPAITSTAAYSVYDELFPEEFRTVFVQGFSKIHMEVSCNLMKGAWLSKAYCLVAGKRYDIDVLDYDRDDYLSPDFDGILSTSLSLDIPDIQYNSGKVDIIYTIIDSRGFSVTKESYITVQPYSAPQIRDADVYRADSDSNKTPKGTNLHVTAEKLFSNIKFYVPLVSATLQLNHCRIECRFKPSSAVWDAVEHPWITLLADDSESINYRDLLKDENSDVVVFEKATPYTVELRAQDTIGASIGREAIVYSFNIPSAFAAYHIAKGGKRICLFGYADELKPEGFYVEGDSYYKGNINGNLFGTIRPQHVTNVLTFAIECPVGLTPIYLTAEDADTTELPTTYSWANSYGFIFKTNENRFSVILYHDKRYVQARNNYLNFPGDNLTGWQGWNLSSQSGYQP